MVSIIIDRDRDSDRVLNRDSGGDNENIELRSYRVEDAFDLFTAINDSRQHLSPWLNWVGGTTKPEHSRQFIEQSIYKLEMQEELSLGIWYNQKLIGGLGMLEWDQKIKRAQIGYWVAKNYEGKGIAYLCLAHFIDFIFSKLGLNKLEIQFLPANQRSAKIAARLGFKIEGIIRQCHLRNGQLEDLVITGLLKKEWTK